MEHKVILTCMYYILSENPIKNDRNMRTIELALAHVCMSFMIVMMNLLCCVVHPLTNRMLAFLMKNAVKNSYVIMVVHFAPL